MNDEILYTRLRAALEQIEPAELGDPPRPALVLDSDGPIRGIGDVAILLHELDVRIRALRSAH